MFKFNFSKINALVVGDAILDCYYDGQTKRISPEAPVPILKVEKIDYLAGGAANVAVNMQKLGAKTRFLSQIGKDKNGQLLKKILKKHNIKCDFIKTENPTSLKSRLMSRHQQLMRFDQEQIKNVDQKILKEKFENHLDQIDIVVFSDYAKGVISNQVQTLIDLAKTKNIPVLIDPKSADFSAYKKSTLVTPNLTEFNQAYHFLVNKDKLVVQSDLKDKAKQLIDFYAIDSLLITQGSQGMSLIDKQGSFSHQKTSAISVYDVTGAGDSVIAVMACAIAAGLDKKQAMHLANIAAGIVVSKSGTAYASLDEIKQKLIEESKLNTNAISQEDLIDISQILKACGQKIVLTNGCFDLLHAGHLDYLQKAKQFGDFLIVLINNDDSVRRLKGQQRPIINLNERMRILKGLSCVDWVCAFSEDTPENLIEKINPNILVKGSDYNLNQIVGAQKVLKNGGEVKTIDFTFELSTSEIIEKIKKL